MRYAHTDLIARDAKKLVAFYQEVFLCRSIGETRDLRGKWLDELTGLKNAHLTGEHLLLPGYGEDHPTLEIFHYDSLAEAPLHRINQPGLAHLAFEVENVEETLQKVLSYGGSMVGQLVHADYEDGRHATFVYAADPEGNILELQSWD